MSARTTWVDVTRSELVKLRTLRAQWGLLAAGALATLVLGPVQSIGQTLGAAGATRIRDADAAVSLAMSGAATGAIVIGILGALVVATEYARGSIAVTFSAVPRRGLVVAAKAVALAATGLLVLVPTSVVAFEVSRRILSTSGQDAGWAEPGVVRSVALTAWLLVGWALLGMVLGWVTRNALGASFALLGLMFVLPALVGLFGEAGRTLAPYLPSEVGLAMLRVGPSPGPLGPWSALGLWTGYLLLGLALARWRVSRRDA